MRYKVIDYYSEMNEHQTGTCDLCFGTADVDDDIITLEDENAIKYEIPLTVWDWGDYETLYIDNIIKFTAWLKEQDVEPIEEKYQWAWLRKLIRSYSWEDYYEV